MPRRAPLEDDAENFTAELDAIEDTGSGSDGDSERDGISDAESDVGTATRILTAPQPDAPMHEVRKVSFFRSRF
jgi:hypothetical protein